MAKTAAISTRVDPRVKSEAESLFGSFGLSLTEAIDMLLHKPIMEGGLPFGIRQPRCNAETEKSTEEARAIMAGKVRADSRDSAKAATGLSCDDALALFYGSATRQLMREACPTCTREAMATSWTGFLWSAGARRALRARRPASRGRAGKTRDRSICVKNLELRGARRVGEDADLRL